MESQLDQFEGKLLIKKKSFNYFNFAAEGKMQIHGITPGKPVLVFKQFIQSLHYITKLKIKLLPNNLTENLTQNMSEYHLGT